MKETKIVRYSEAFKREVVHKYETSSLSKREVQLRYGIKGGATINQWIRKFGKTSLILNTTRVETPNEKERVKALEAEIKKLKNALSDAFVEKTTYKHMFDITCEIYGIDKKEAKKKVEDKS